jgi:hypothetical protein
MTIQVFPFGNELHNQQVLAGLEVLRRRGELQFVYRYDGLDLFGIDTAGMSKYAAIYQYVVLRIQGIGDIVFDSNDGDGILHKLYDACFLYFKRSYCPNTHASFTRMHPLGLNYEARAPFISLSALYRAVALSKTGSEGIRSLLRALRLPKPYILDPNAGTGEEINFEAPPSVLFLARTWDPARTRTEHRTHYESINEMRAECVRRLRDAFGQQFTGGVIRTAHAAQFCPDCLTQVDLKTDRRSFLGLAERHQICVASRGLHDSMGWKVAEFVAKGRAVVTEKMRFVAPGPFSEAINYLSFRTSDECVEQCANLMRNDELRFRMMIANRAYFLGYVLPESLVRNALHVVALAVRQRERNRSHSNAHRKRYAGANSSSIMRPSAS